IAPPGPLGGLRPQIAAPAIVEEAAENRGVGLEAGLLADGGGEGDADPGHADAIAHAFRWRYGGEIDLRDRSTDVVLRPRATADVQHMIRGRARFERLRRLDEEGRGGRGLVERQGGAGAEPGVDVGPAPGRAG